MCEIMSSHPKNNKTNQHKWNLIICVLERKLNSFCQNKDEHDCDEKWDRHNKCLSNLRHAIFALQH